MNNVSLFARGVAVVAALAIAGVVACSSESGPSTSSSGALPAQQVLAPTPINSPAKVASAPNLVAFARIVQREPQGIKTLIAYDTEGQQISSLQSTLTQGQSTLTLAAGRGSSRITMTSTVDAGANIYSVKIKRAGSAPVVYRDVAHLDPARSSQLS